MSRVDPEANREIASIEGGPGAATLLAVADDVWLGRYGGDPDLTVYRNGIADGAVDIGELCCDLAFLGGAVWGLDPAGSLIGVDTSTLQVVGQFPVTVHQEVHTNVVAGGGSLWVSSDDTPLLRIDTSSGRVLDRVATGGGVPFLEHDGLVWGATTDELWAVNAKTAKVVRRIPLDDSEEVLSLAVDDRSIWVGLRHLGRVGAVVRLDPKSGDVLANIPVDIPARIVLAFHSVWVTDSGSGLLYRVDPDAGSDSRAS
jgi:streptogramin lyase